MPLFHQRVLEKHLKHIPAIDSRHVETLGKWAENLERGIYDSETQNDGEFIQRILIDVLGYVGSSDGAQWTVAKNQPVGKGNVDVALGTFTADSTTILAPLELKGAKTRDLDAIMAGRNKTPVQQAWEYAMDAKGAQWVLVSNYREIRLYAVGYGRKDYEAFDLANLIKPENYARFILLLSAQNLLGGKTLSLLKESEQAEKDITDQLYKDYKILRRSLIDTIAKDNPDKAQLDIIRYTQTILDRILFVAFAEDKGLLPDKTLEKAFETVNPFNPTPVWENFKGLFHAINKGNAALNIPGYNGGLFADDPALHSLNISDELCEGFKKIGEYDFDSEISVNILGHIFEQSITDLEELKAEAEGDTSAFDKKKGKRKKDGIFYTPPYITRYIVEQAVGGWLADRRKEIGFDTLPVLSDVDFESIKITGKRKIKHERNKNIAAHIAAWEAYKAALSQIKVLDPACGSGAFLNEVFDYLKNEGQTINNELARLTGDQTDLFRWDTHILANNIYGVDLNRESVEITKLSLWLKTANRNEKLTYLENNIKVGNSLIDDPAIAGDLAFDWHTEFAEIMDAGGFDVVVGNPPYGANFSAGEKQYFKERYSEIHVRTPESFNYFIYKINRISKSHAGVIIPSSYLKQHEFSKSRQNIASANDLIRVINLGDGVFEDVATPTCIVIWRKNNTTNSVGFYADYSSELRSSLNINLFEERKLIPFAPLSLEYVFTVSPYREIIEKCSKNQLLKQVAEDVATGISSGSDQAFVHTKEVIDEWKLESDLLKKLVIGGEINRYSLRPRSGKFILYITADIDMDLYPKTKSLLDTYKNKLFNRKEAAAGYQLNRPRREKLFKNPKILVRQTANKIMATYDTDGWYCLKSGLLIQLPDSTNISYGYLLALLNSKLMDFIYQDLVGEGTRIFPEVKPVQLFKLPIKIASLDEQQSISEAAEKLLNKSKGLSDLQNKFLALLKTDLATSSIGNKLENYFDFSFTQFVAEVEKSIEPQKLTLVQKSEWMQHFEAEKAKALTLKAEIDRLDAEIDQMVYALYGLTPDEIAIVEGGA